MSCWALELKGSARTVEHLSYTVVSVSCTANDPRLTTHLISDRPFFGKRRHSLVPSYVYPLFRGKTILLLASLALFLLATELTLKDYVYTYPLFQSVDALAATELSSLHSRSICPTCNSSEVGSFAKSSTAHPMPSLERLQSGKATEAEIARYIATNIYMRGQEDPTPMDDVARFKMLSTFLTNPDLLFSYSFEGIKMRRPTSYIFTRVGGGDRLGTSELRLKYLQRHADTIDEYHELVEREGFSYGVGTDDRQLLWIIVEDDAQIDQNTANWLASTGLRTYLRTTRRNLLTSHYCSLHLLLMGSDKVSHVTL